MKQPLPQRKSIRLRNFDYSSQGLYFITICIHNRLCLLGDIINGKMILNNAGRMINQWYLKTPYRFKNTTLDEYQIMPNHLHGIVIITGNGRTHGSAPTDNKTNHVAIPVGVDPCVDPNNPCANPKQYRQQQTLFKTIRWFKTMATNNYIRNVKTKNWKPFNKRLFQRNYFEHIIRNENDLNEIREYIKNNPQTWDRNRNNPAKSGLANK